MSFRRNKGRGRGAVSFGRRTPRLNFDSVRDELVALSLEAPRVRAEVVEFSLRSARTVRSPRAGIRS